MGLSVIILAAGQGTRMRSSLPKVLHKLAAFPLVEHVYNTTRQLHSDRVIVVYGHGGDIVQNQLQHLDVKWVEQQQQLGTGHAVAQALPYLSDDDFVLVLYGDVPLTKVSTLSHMVQEDNFTGLNLLTVNLCEPKGYGRIIRNSEGSIIAIVEEKDATPAQRTINEVNTGVMSMPAKLLKKWVGQLSNNNAQAEYYLTDVVSMAVNDGVTINSTQPEFEYEVLGVNNRMQLAQLERQYQLLQAEQLMTNGVSLRDPARLDVRGEIIAGRDVVIDVNVIFEGRVSLGEGVRIGPNCLIRNSTIAANAEILANCVIDESSIGENCRVGPFARIRPGTELLNDVHIGNFVEIKKSRIEQSSKVNHLSYIGDTDIGRDVNIGAGTITCNYDGANKYRTVIGNDVFIGSDTQLVAPIHIGDGATIGAGTTLTKDAPPGLLTLSRADQVTIKNWRRPVKKK